jgi:hypothetical protein
MISRGRESEEPLPDLGNLSEADIAAYYFNIKSIPCLISSPLRQDKKPSFALYSPNGTDVNFIDFSNRDSGTIWTLLTKAWNCSYHEAKRKVFNDLGNKSLGTSIGIGNYLGRNVKVNTHLDLQCRVRDWRKYDLEYWESYGISLKWLKYADVYPISHKIIIKDNISYAFGADKYAYAYVEFKEGKTTLKIYQPFNTKGYKWSNRHDKSVISLWTKVPKIGDRVCICSSLKDALCLWANTGIPALAIQGEGYGISNTAVKELRTRFKKVYICLDNDKAGIKDAIKLAEDTGFINIVLPKFAGGKDISDYYKVINNKDEFKKLILKLFNND